MPYARYGVAISHYLELLRKIAEEYGNPFRPADLPDPIFVDGKSYSKETLKRYMSWIKHYYRKKSMEIPFEIRYVPDKRRGLVAEVYVDIDRINRDIEVIRNDTGRIPSPRRRRQEIDRLRDRLRKSRKMLEKCRESLSMCNEELEKAMSTIAGLKKHALQVSEVVRRVIDMSVEQLYRCIEDINNEADECVLVRLVIDKALIVDKDGVSGFDIATTVIDEDYIEKLRKQARKLKKKYSTYTR